MNFLSVYSFLTHHPHYPHHALPSSTEVWCKILRFQSYAKKMLTMTSSPDLPSHQALTWLYHLSPKNKWLMKYTHFTMINKSCRITFLKLERALSRAHTFANATFCPPQKPLIVRVFNPIPHLPSHMCYDGLTRIRIRIRIDRVMTKTAHFAMSWPPLTFDSQPLIRVITSLCHVTRWGIEFWTFCH